MLVLNYAYGYSRKKKYITGRGFVDSLSNVFNSIKASAVPAMKSIGSYVSNNKDLIAKPLLGAVGTLAATGLTAGVPALMSHIMRRKTAEDPKHKEIMESLAPPSRVSAAPVTNIIGSGAIGLTLASLRAAGTGGVRKKRGSGIKKF